MGNITPHPLESVRSFLFTPGNRPDRFEKALASGADAIVLDLEDAVPPAEKPIAREAVAAAWPRLRSSTVPVIIRINSPALPVGQDDLAWLSSLSSRPAGLMIPKAESAAALAAAHTALPGTALLPLIESAAGHAALSMIAAAPGVLRLVLGHIDFMADTGIRCSDDEAELAPLRFALTMASRCHDLAPAVDGVTVDLKNDERLRLDTLRSLRFGFGAKLCIHPRQVAVIHQALHPTPDEITWARRVLEADAAAGGQAVQLDGKIVDLPLVLQARRLLARVDPERT
ncbi:HpcH/HpaI aldolase/citrate lyase family protein [Castellaniella sp.]|uniref:HpcH/HpaI aldolase/citrate lyase family protein n=1 Tax=Castellaniella sp. TaxID=1955812 RepID=UPI003A8D82B1